MKTLDKYIIKKFLASFLFVVFIVVLIIVVIDITEKINNFTDDKVPTVRILEYYMNFVPWIANLISPITVFIATVFVTANMASHSEIVAILASGVSFRRMLAPYLAGAIIIGLVSFYFNGWVIPAANKNRRSFEIEFIEAKYYFNKNNFHIQVSPNEYLYMSRYNNQTNRGYQFTIEKVEGTKLVEKLSAHQIDWLPDSRQWLLRKWQKRVITDSTEVVTLGDSLILNSVILPQDF